MHLEVGLALGTVGAVRAGERGLARVDTHVGAQVLVAVAAAEHPPTDAAHHHRHGRSPRAAGCLQHNTTQRLPPDTRLTTPTQGEAQLPPQP